MQEQKHHAMKDRHLIASTPRPKLAAALLEYRRYTQNHQDELASSLADISRRIRVTLREEREFLRVIGWNEKPNERLSSRA